jgi:hypothetical protein
MVKSVIYRFTLTKKRIEMNLAALNILENMAVLDANYL